MRRHLTAEQVAQAFRDACLAELDALKPGNVHRFGDDPRMSVTDFETSARVAAAEKSRAAARRADDWVHGNPWAAVGAAAGVGFLLGMLVSRR